MINEPRTDIHRPSVLVTEDYEYVLAEVNHIEDLPGWVARNGDYGMDLSRWIARTDKLGRGTFQCHHCGARLNYFAILRHVPTGDAIVVGETCLENRFSRATADFHRLRKMGKLGREAAARRHSAQMFLDGAPEAFVRAMTPGEPLDGFDFDEWATETVEDIRSALWRYGQLTDRQTALVLRLIEEAPARKAERERQAAERAAEVEIPAPVGRCEIVGTVIKLAEKFTQWGSTIKVTIKSVDENNNVWLGWVTCPKDIESTVKRGDTVRLTATWEPAEEGGSFAFGKRPAKAEILEVA